MAESEADMIRRTASQWLKDNEAKARGLIEHNPQLTVEELQQITGWSDVQVNNMLTYLGMVQPA